VIYCNVCYICLAHRRFLACGVSCVLVQPCVHQAVAAAAREWQCLPLCLLLQRLDAVLQQHHHPILYALARRRVRMLAGAPTEGQDESSTTLLVDHCERIKRELPPSERVKVRSGCSAGQRPISEVARTAQLWTACGWGDRGRG
jgi:hypothetical protein